MARTPDQIAPEVIGGAIYRLLAQIATLEAKIEELQEKLELKAQERKG